jgi:hypothetical protein
MPSVSDFEKAMEGGAKETGVRRFNPATERVE